MTKKSAAYVLITMLLFAASGVMAQEAPTPTVLVIPPRYTIVKLGLDMVALRPVLLVSCQEGNAGTVMHVWNDDPGEWLHLPVDTFRSGEMFRVQPRDIVIVGSDQDVPGLVVDAARALAPVKRVETLNLVSVINALNESLKFDRNEWRWLAGRYNLTLKDLNSERRRYGKYGPPGGSREEVIMPMAEDEAEILSTPVEAPVVPAAAPVVVEEEPAREEWTAKPPVAVPAPIPETAPEDK